MRENVSHLPAFRDVSSLVSLAGCWHGIDGDVRARTRAVGAFVIHMKRSHAEVQQETAALLIGVLK